MRYSKPLHSNDKRHEGIRLNAVISLVEHLRVARSTTGHNSLVYLTQSCQMPKQTTE